MIHRIGHKLKRRDGDDAPESIANFRNDMDLQNTSGSPATGSVRKSQPRRTHDVMTSFNTNGPRNTHHCAASQRPGNLLTATQPSPLATNRQKFAFPDFTCRGWGFFRVNPAVGLCRSEPEAPSPHTLRAAPASPPRTANKDMVKIGGALEKALWTLAN